MTSVKLPDTVTVIEEYAFANSSLAFVELTASLTYIADNAFRGCSRFAVNVPANCYAFDWCTENGLIGTESPLVLSESRWYASAEDEEHKYTLKSVSTWEITEQPEWMSISPLAGEKGSTEITVKYASNESGEDRSGHLYLENNTAVRVIPVTQAAYPLSVEISANPLQMLGEAIAFVMNVSGGVGNMAYRYLVFLNDALIETSSWNTSSDFKYITENVGNYRILGQVQDASGNTAEADYSFVISQNGMNSAGLQVVGSGYNNETMSLYAFVIGGNAPYSYSYEIFCDNESVHRSAVINESRYIYYPEKAGTYTASVEITDSDGKTIKEISNQYIVHAVRPLAITGVFSNTNSTAAGNTGEGITWTVSVEGGVKPYTYLYTMVMDDQVVDTLETVSNQYFYASNKPGQATLVVNVTDADGTTVISSIGSIEYTEGMPRITSVDCSTKYAYVGNEISWVVNVEGQTADLIYEYYIAGEYTESKQNTFNWTTDIPGKYSLDVSIMQEDEYVDWVESKTVIIGEQLSSVSFIKAVPTTSTTGKSITWVAAANGGCGTITYDLNVYCDGKLVHVSQQNEDGEFSWTPSLPGEYNAVVYARDSMGTTVWKESQATIVTEEQISWTQTAEADFKYSITTEGTATITKYMGKGGAVVVPSKLGGYTVTEVDKYAFNSNNEITHVELPDSITIIGYHAFAYCENLISIRMPKNLVEIGQDAFFDCVRLKSIYISDSLKKVRKDAFHLCYSLENVFAESVSGWVGIEYNNMFASPMHNAKNLYIDGELVTKVSIPKGVETINKYAFMNCISLTEVVIPDSVTTMGASAFLNCENLKKVTLSANLQAIAAGAFKGSAIAQMELPHGLEAIGSSAFSNTPLKNINIPSTVKEIGEAAFEYCDLLEEILIPDSVETIGKNAFYNCNNLKKVRLPNNLVRIEETTFLSCAFESIDIPSTVEYIGGAAFSSCRNLKSIDIPDSVTLIGNAAFLNCKTLQKVKLPSYITKIGSSCFAGCRGLKSIVIPNEVTQIGYNAFSGCANLLTIHLPENLLEIASSTFDSCEKLYDLKIPDGVLQINDNAFRNCYSLTSIKLPSSLQTINWTAFYGCENLVSIDASDCVSLTTLQGFPKCAKLTSIEMPPNIVEIGYQAFCDCSSLENIEMSPNIVKIGSHAFYGCSSLEKIDIPSGVTRIEEWTFLGCTNLAFVDIPENVTYIGFQAFSGCYGLKQLIIPESVMGIGGFAFEECTNLESIYIPASVTELGNRIMGDYFDGVIYGTAGSRAEEYAAEYDITFLTTPMPGSIEEGAINIYYPEAGNVLEPAAAMFQWKKVQDALSYRVALRDLTEYPDGSEAPQSIISKTVYTEKLDISENILIPGHQYRFWVAGYSSSGAIVAQTQLVFSVRAEDESPAPSCTQSYASKQVPSGSELYFSGKIQPNGGALQRVTISIVEDATNNYCYYQTISAVEMVALGAEDLTEFNLSLVPAIDTGSIVKADQDGHLTSEQLTQTVDMSKPGFYTINIWAINEGNSNAVLASKYQVEVVESTASDAVPQIFFFHAEKEKGYKAQEYTFTAETTGDVTSVELYVDGYLVKPEIELELWNGYHFYTLTTPIWDAGNRLCKLVVKTAKGEKTEASCYVEVKDAEYKQLPKPVLTSPMPYADGEARGVVNAPFILSWEANEEFAAKVLVTISKDGQTCFYREVTGSNTIEIPDTVLTEVGLYSIAVVATQLGYETSEFCYLSLRAYANEQAILQELCPHDGEVKHINQGIKWRLPNAYDAQHHYVQEYYDKACELCGKVLEAKVFTTDEYVAREHQLVDSTYCECGYCIGYGDEGENAYLNQDVNLPVYRTPTDRRIPVGYLYPYDTVKVLYEFKDLYYVSYYSDAYKCDRYGFVSWKYMDLTLSFAFKNNSGTVYVDDIIEESFGFEKIYYANIDNIRNVFDANLMFDENSAETFVLYRSASQALSGTMHVYNSNYDVTYFVNFDLTGLVDGDETTSFAIPFTGNLVGIGGNGSSASAWAPTLTVRFVLLNGKVYVSLENLCELAGYVFSPERKTCYANRRTKAVVWSEIEAMEQDVLDAAGKLYKGPISEFYQKYSDFAWVTERINGAGAYRLVERMIAEGPTKGIVNYAKEDSWIALLLNEGEYKGEEIAAALVQEKLLELEMEAFEEQGEANWLLTVMYALKGTQDVNGYGKKLTKLLKASDEDIAALIQYITKGKGFLEEDMQDVYAWLKNLPGGHNIIPLLRNYNNGPLKRVVDDASKLVKFIYEVDEAKALNYVYVQYREELIDELYIWAESYKGSALEVNIADLIEKISKLESDFDIYLQSFLDANLIEKIAEDCVKLGGSLLMKAAGKGLLSAGAHAIPIVGQVVTVIDLVNTATQLAGMDLAQSMNDSALVQVSIKYYNDSYKEVLSFVRDIGKANPQKAEKCILALKQCEYWQNIMIRHLSSGLQSVTPTEAPLMRVLEEVMGSADLDALVKMNVDAVIRESQTQINLYVDLLEEYFDLGEN